MKKLTLLLTLILVANLIHAQSALDLVTGSQVNNSIIFGNSNAAPVSAGVQVTFSASDSVLPAGNNNVYLPITPFRSGFTIGTESLAFDRGNRLYLNPADVVDLDFSPRVSCEDLDIGAFEVPIVATQITVQPTPIGRVCEGSSVLFHVEAIGEGITVQWQRNGVNLIGRTSPTLAIPNVSMADVGSYRAIVFGACCNDTSNVVHLDMDLRPKLVMMNDTTILSGENVKLHAVESIGTVHWFESDMKTAVLNPNITNITEGMLFFAVARNGTCADTVMASVQIIVDGSTCRVRTFPDETVCSGDPHRLLIDEATVTARWFLAGTTTELPNGSIVHPTETSHFVLVGFDSNGNACWIDTLTLTVPEIEFNVREDGVRCRSWHVDLYSTPPADGWFVGDNHLLGTGNISFFMGPTGETTTYTAQYTDSSTGCVIRKDVTMISMPLYFTLPFANFVGLDIQRYPLYAVTICEGDSLHLQTSIDPSFITWERLSDNIFFENNPTIVATTSDIYRAHIFDPGCGNMHVDLTVTVQPRPNFEIQPPSPIYAGMPIHLTSIPNTPIWTDLDGTRVFMPITMQEPQHFIGVFRYGVCEVRDTILVEVSEDSIPPLPPPSPEMQVAYTATTATNRDCDNATVTVSVTDGIPPYDFEWQRLGHDDIWQQPYSDGELHLFNVLSGVYLFTVFDSQDSVLLFQIPVSCEYKQAIAPTTLVTPNGDGLNDHLFIHEIEFFPINTVTIINSYGAEITTIRNFSNDDPNHRWDGKNRHGQFVPDGTYWYIIQAEGISPMTGWIIVRDSPRQ